MPGLASQGAPPPTVAEVIEKIVDTAELTTVGEVVYEDTIKPGFQWILVGVGEANPDAPGDTDGDLYLELRDANGVWQEQVAAISYASYDNEDRPYFYFSQGGYETRASTGAASSGGYALTSGLGWDEYGIDFPWKFPLSFRLIVAYAFSGTPRKIKLYMIYVRAS